MSNENTSATAVETKPEAKPAKAKKAVKAKTKPAAKKEGSGLRKPMVRILKALKKANRPLTRKEISEKAPVDVASCVEYLGSHDDATRKANDKKHFPSLLTLGLVKFDSTADGGVAYAISAKGRTAADKE